LFTERTAFVLSRVSFSSRPDSLPPEGRPQRLEKPDVDFLAEEARVIRDVFAQRPNNDYTTRLDFSTNKDLARARASFTQRMIRLARQMNPDTAKRLAADLDTPLKAYDGLKASGEGAIDNAKAFLETVLMDVNNTLRQFRLDSACERKQALYDWKAAKRFARAEYFRAYRAEQARTSLPARLGSRLLDALFPGRVERILPFELQRPYRPYRRLERLIDPYAKSVPNPRATYFDESYDRIRRRFRITREHVAGTVPPVFECRVQDDKMGNLRTRRYRTPKDAPTVAPAWTISEKTAAPGAIFRRAYASNIGVAKPRFD
jgi:hypothetical protein